jgi:ribosome maturation factor RimP
VGPEPTFFIGPTEETVNVTTLWDSIETYLAAESVELDDLVWSGRVLKVTVDAEGGVDVDHIAELARAISRLLDDDPSLNDPYTLEVSSPGLERPLRRPSHYRKSIGREVTVTTTVPIDGETHHRGILTSYDDSTLTITTADADRLVPTDSVSAARTLFSWASGGKPGKKAT